MSIDMQPPEPAKSKSSLAHDINKLDKQKDQSVMRAKILLQDGEDIAYIAQVTGLPIITIMRLKQEIS